jgi:predicted lipoprotein with Yx(FWY)xxD motif
MTRISIAVLLAALAGALAPGAADATPAAGTAAAAQAPPTLTVRTTRFGRILFDGRGRVLYAFTRDRRGGPSRCYGDCATAWPVYFAPKTALRAGVGVKRSLLGTTRRRGGRRQITYNGWPLYYYAHERRGEVKCQNVFTHGGLWLVVRPNGRPVR